MSPRQPPLFDDLEPRTPTLDPDRIARATGHHIHQAYAGTQAFTVLEQMRRVGPVTRQDLVTEHLPINVLCGIFDQLKKAGQIVAVGHERVYWPGGRSTLRTKYKAVP